jgi:hypothetical protein
MKPSVDEYANAAATPELNQLDPTIWKVTTVAMYWQRPSIAFNPDGFATA